MLNVSVAISASQLVSTHHNNLTTQTGVSLHTASIHNCTHGGHIRTGMTNHNPQSAKIISTKFCKRPIHKNLPLDNLALYGIIHLISKMLTQPCSQTLPPSSIKLGDGLEWGHHWGHHWLTLAPTCSTVYHCQASPQELTILCSLLAFWLLTSWWCCTRDSYNHQQEDTV